MTSNDTGSGTRPPGRLQVRQATQRDLPTVVSILNEAAQWLQGRQIDQWQGGFDASLVLPGITDGHVWLAEIEDQDAGTFTLSWSDPLWQPDDDGGYIHRLAVRRRFPGLGVHLLRFAAHETKQHARHYLRLDCGAANHRLRAYYEQAGFRHRGDVEVVTPASLTLSLYQMAVSGRADRQARDHDSPE